MPTLRKYNVFISHAWGYNADYWKIVGFLNEAPNFIWNNLSVPEHDPIQGNDLSAELRNQMREADVFLIIAGMYAAHSEWIDFEVQFARRIGRPIIGIQKWGSDRIPVIIQNGATEVVGWSSASIVRAIREHALARGS